MINHNKDYRKEIAENHIVMYVVDKNCPECNSRLVVLPPDRVWCESIDCNYSQLHIIGDGVAHLKTEVKDKLCYHCLFPIDDCECDERIK